MYRYTRDRWGNEQADRYIRGLFDAFDKIETHGEMSRPVPAEFGVDGFFFRYARHVVYWRRLSNGDIRAHASDRSFPRRFSRLSRYVKIFLDCGTLIL
ncbi:type II toxin-antitoxin system RelE/ParE family toxin [Methylosinus sp. Ce-a6]|uniref:type II toxin-antitoxin system RelE/ParE family toxin n=1 Tax=Methylosinus sp. Ce-a6 TaxID=2172005 RepID=UPI0034D4A3F0